MRAALCAGDYGILPEGELLKRLQGYVDRDSPSGGLELCNRFAGLLERDFAAAGCRVERQTRGGRDALVCRVGGGPSQLLLLGHFDTVFPAGAARERPFRRTPDGLLLGPGVLDMKSGVCMIQEIMRHFARRTPRGWSLCAVLNSDEETGSAQSEELIRAEAKRSRFCLCMEPSKPGFCTVRRKGILRFAVEVDGAAAHAGVNYTMGRSAVQALADLVVRLYALRDDERGVSVNVGRMEGGSGQDNVVADRARATAELRCWEPERMDGLRERVRAICAKPCVPDVRARAVFFPSRPPMRRTEASGRLLEWAAALAPRHGLALEGRGHGGGSDGSFAADEGTPVLDGLGAEGEFSHTAQEYVRAGTLVPRTRLAVDLIEKCFGGL